jgi:hypothetical protein
MLILIAHRRDAQRGCAHAIGVPVKTLQNWEQGRRQLTDFGQQRTDQVIERAGGFGGLGMAEHVRALKWHSRVLPKPGNALALAARSPFRWTSGDACPVSV